MKDNIIDNQPIQQEQQTQENINNNIDNEDTYLSPSSFVNNGKYNIDALRDLFQKEKRINKDGIEILKIKDYDTLCNIIDAKKQYGKEKKLAQGKDFKRFFSFSRYGQSYLIDTIYDCPLPQGFYNNPIDILSQYLICNLIENCEDQILTCSMNKLAYRLGYVNSLFFQEKKSIGKFANNILLDSKRNKQIFHENVSLCEDVFDYIPKKYKYRINKALDALENKSLIFVQDIFYGEKISFDTESISSIQNFDEFGDPLPTTYEIKGESNFRILTDKEIEQFLEIRKKLLKEFKFDSFDDLYSSSFKKNGKYVLDLFFEQLKVEAKKELGFDNIYPSLKIVFTKKYIQQENQNLFSQLEAMNMINKSFGEKLIQNKENELNRKLEKLDEEKSKYNIPEGFYQKQKNSLLNNFRKEKKVISKLIFRD